MRIGKNVSRKTKNESMPTPRGYFHIKFGESRSRSRHRVRERKRKRSATPIFADADRTPPPEMDMEPSEIDCWNPSDPSEPWNPSDLSDPWNRPNVNDISCSQYIHEPYVDYDNNNSEYMSDSEEEPFLVGALRNIGNSCYMNAVLYVLRYTPNFTHYIHHLAQNLEIFVDEVDPNRVQLGCCDQQMASAQFALNLENWQEMLIDASSDYDVVRVLHETFKNLTELEVPNGDTCRPYRLRNAVFRVDDTFSPGTQQDSHEFLLCVLNSIRDCSDVAKGLAHTYTDLFENINDPATLLNFNYFADNFTGLRVTSKRCISCETNVDVPEEIIDVLITLSSKSELSENFIQNSCVTVEKLDGDDKLRCEDCCGYFEARKEIVYPRLPRFLIVQLARFDNNMNKIEMATPVPFTTACFCSDCVENLRTEGNILHQYHLYGIILHVGHTLQSGHYISYVKSLDQSACISAECCHVRVDASDQSEQGSDADTEWLICDDDDISTITQTELAAKLQDEASSKTPYVLFYARNDAPTM